MLHFDYLICPIEYDDETNRMSLECEKNPVFMLADYDFPETMQALFMLVSVIVMQVSLKIWNFQLHDKYSQTYLKRPLKNRWNEGL